MKTYVGVRTHRGCYVFVYDDVKGAQSPLRHRNDLTNHCPDGFHWGDISAGSAQLALAILADATQDDELALRMHQIYKCAVIARLKAGKYRRWIIRASDVTLAVKQFMKGYSHGEQKPKRLDLPDQSGISRRDARERKTDGATLRRI